MAKGDFDLGDHWPEFLVVIVLIGTILITLLAQNAFAGYVSVAIIAFCFGGIYTTYYEKGPLWPVMLICCGAVVGVFIGSSFGRRFFVLIWYFLVLFLSIYAFRQNLVKRFKRKDWIK